MRRRSPTVAIAPPRPPAAMPPSHRPSAANAPPSIVRREPELGLWRVSVIGDRGRAFYRRSPTVAIAPPRPPAAMPPSHRPSAANAPPSIVRREPELCVDAPSLGGSRSRLLLTTLCSVASVVFDDTPVQGRRRVQLLYW